MLPATPLIITLSNDLHLTNVPPGIAGTLTEQLKFLNPKWLENERMGRWNKGTSKILRFYRKTPNGGLKIPRGYIRQLILLCRSMDVPYEIDDRRRSLAEVDFSFTGTLKPFQEQAVAAMLSKYFGTLNAPTGSGKTVMALKMIASRRQPALVIVHTKDLALQWMDRAESFLGIPKTEIGLFGAGKSRIGEKLTIALVQSVYKRADEIARRVGFLIVDEAHRCPSRTFTEAVKAFDSKFMLGLSATPWRRDKLSKLIFWFLGDVHYQVDKSRLITSGEVLSAEVIVRETNFKPYYDPVNDYSKMLSELTSDDERNRLIASDVAREAQHGDGGVCLVLSDRKNHCETLQAMLRFKYKIASEILTGDLTTRQRQEVLARLNKGHIDVLVATGQLVGEGFDARELSTLFLATPIRFSGRLLQYLGRVLRPAPGKVKAKVYDYVDVQVDVLKAAADARQRIYSR